MGSNRRYPDNASKLSEERELRTARQNGPLHTLNDEQLELYNQPLTIAPERAKITALAWLQFGNTHIRTTVTIKRWTPTAVGIELTHDGDTLRCWIWQGACQRTDS